MLIRQLSYLVALAREKHFGRAAAACNISQPSLSASIRQMEAELGVPIVERGHRFNGLTSEGEQILESAKRILNEVDHMRQALSDMRGGLSGRLRLGCIPTALPMVPALIRRFLASYPQVTFDIISMSSEAIQKGIDDFTLEAGITYLDNEPLVRVKARPMHRQTFAVLTRADGPLAGRDQLSWTEAAELSLCLLGPNMQNRRIIDGVFRTLGRTPIPVIETNSINILASHAAIPGLSSIVPSQLVRLLPLPEGTMTLRLVEPEVVRSIGLIIADRQPTAPLARILLDLVGDADVDAALCD